MGIFFVDLEVSSDFTGVRQGVRVEKVMVDTGSELTWLPAAVLAHAGIRVAKKDQAFRRANGQTITRDVGFGRLRSGDFVTVDEIVFAREGDLALLGSRTLEGFNASVDSVGSRLVAAGPIPAAGNRRS